MSLERRLPRHVLWDTLVYVNLDRANGGIILNLNELGMAVQAAAPVRAQAPVQVNFQLPGTATFVETRGEVCWSNAGQAGIQFVGLSEPERRKLKEALFDSLLTRCAAAHGVTAEPEHRAVVPVHQPAASQCAAAEETPPVIATEPTPGPAIQFPPRRPTITRQRESVLLLAGTALFAAAFLLTAEIPAEAGILLLTGMAVPCVLLAVLHQLVELPERE